VDFEVFLIDMETAEVHPVGSATVDIGNKITTSANFIGDTMWLNKESDVCREMVRLFTEKVAGEFPKRQ
jgi:hypothetical protein